MQVDFQHQPSDAPADPQQMHATQLLASFEAQLRQRSTDLTAKAQQVTSLEDQLSRRNAEVDQLQKELVALKRSAGKGGVLKEVSQNVSAGPPGAIAAAKRNEAFPQSAAVAAATERSSSPSPAVSTTNTTPVVIAHLKAQIDFLHKEVERLEQATTDARESAAEERAAQDRFYAREVQGLQATNAGLSQELARTKAQMKQMQQHCGTLAKGENYATRCKELEQKLAATMSERTEALNEKFELQRKVRTLEEKLRGSHSAVAHLKCEQAEGMRETGDEVAKLRATISALNLERNSLQTKVDVMQLKFKNRPTVAMAEAGVQCEARAAPTEATAQTDPVPRPSISVLCQVNTTNSAANVGGVTMVSASEAPGQQQQPSPSMTAQHTNSSGDNHNNNHSSSAAATAHDVNVPLLLQNLESKCSEADSYRAQLEELARRHDTNSDTIKQLRQSLEQEINRCRSAEADAEHLRTHQRGMQQQLSQLQVALRDKSQAVAAADDRVQKSVASVVAAEKERKQWEEQLAANASDIQLLTEQTRLANEQISKGSAENESLRAELQKQVQQHHQMEYALQFKQAEVQDVVSNYQQCVQEYEAQQDALRSLEKEIDNMRVSLSSRDQRILSMQEQIAGLHHREQQLVLDLQSLDFENGVLRKKLAQGEIKERTEESEAEGLRGNIVAMQKVMQEYERSVAELHKQLVIKENENMFLRQRAESAEYEFNGLSATHQLTAAKLKEVEEAHARLAVKNVVASAASASAQSHTHHDLTEAQQSLASISAELSALRKKHDETTAALAMANKSLSEEQSVVQSLRTTVAEKQCRLEDLLASHDRLKQMLEDHASMLGGEQ